MCRESTVSPGVTQNSPIPLRDRWSDPSRCHWSGAQQYHYHRLISPSISITLYDRDNILLISLIYVNYIQVLCDIVQASIRLMGIKFIKERKKTLVTGSTGRSGMSATHQSERALMLPPCGDRQVSNYSLKLAQLIEQTLGLLSQTQ